MAAIVTAPVQAATEANYERAAELEAFDDTKGGVKGLVDSGIASVPQMFHQPPDGFKEASKSIQTQFSFPVVDLDCIDREPIKSKEAVDKVRKASESWGFFQVINRGIPASVLEEMINGVHKFYEQDSELRKQ